MQSQKRSHSDGFAVFPPRWPLVVPRGTPSLSQGSFATFEGVLGLHRALRLEGGGGGSRGPQLSKVAWRDLSTHQQSRIFWMCFSHLEYSATLLNFGLARLAEKQSCYEHRQKSTLGFCSPQKEAEITRSRWSLVSTTNKVTAFGKIST